MINIKFAIAFIKSHHFPAAEIHQHFSLIQSKETLAHSEVHLNVNWLAANIELLPGVGDYPLTMSESDGQPLYLGRIGFSTSCYIKVNFTRCITVIESNRTAIQSSIFHGWELILSISTTWLNEVASSREMMIFGTCASQNQATFQSL